MESTVPTACRIQRVRLVMTNPCSTAARACLASCLLAAFLPLPAAGAEAKPVEGIHLPGEGEVGWLWTLNDSTGMRWDIDSGGRVNDGQNDAYDGGMRLMVNNNDFQWNEAGRLGTGGRETEVGPWNVGSVQVSRRIYVDDKVGYCRWIDIFENNSGQAQTINVRWMTAHGGSNKEIIGVAGKGAPTDKDWGFTVVNNSDSRPGVIHVISDRSARVRPKVQLENGNRQVNCSLSLTVPAGKASAVCIFQLQRPANSAVEDLKKFKLEEEFRKIPQSLRRILVNIGGGEIVSIGDIDLPRRETGDLVVLRNENELLGTLLNSDYQVETSFGKITLPAERVLGLTAAVNEQHVQVVLTDAQVVVGRLLNQPLRIRLGNGNEMKLPTQEIRTASYRLAPPRPKTLTAAGCFAVMRQGHRLIFPPEAPDCTFQTEWGQVKLDPQTLQAIVLDTPDNGLHLAVFRNGSTLSGLLLAESFELPLQLGMPLSIRRHEIQKLVFGPASPPVKGKMVLTLRNDDELVGSLAESALAVDTPFGKVSAATAEMVELTVVEGPPGSVQIKMQSGTTISGRLSAAAMKFQVEPGPLLSVYAGHVVSISTDRQAAGPAVGATGAQPPPAAEAGPPAIAVPMPMPPMPGAPMPARARVNIVRRLDAARAEVAAKAEAEAAAKAAHDKALADKAAAMAKEAAEKDQREKMAKFQAERAAMMAAGGRSATTQPTTRPNPTTAPTTAPPTTQPAT